MNDKPDPNRVVFVKALVELWVGKNPGFVEASGLPVSEVVQMLTDMIFEHAVYIECEWESDTVLKRLTLRPDPEALRDANLFLASHRRIH